MPAYRAKFGVPHVPALELDDGTCLTESIAICRYLEALHPEPNLFGRDPKEQAIIEMWMRRCEMYLANPMMLNVRFTHPALAALEAPQPQVAEYNRLGAERFMKTLDRHLAEHEFIAADRFTIADIVLGHCLHWAERYERHVSKPILRDYLARVEARPAYRTADSA